MRYIPTWHLSASCRHSAGQIEGSQRIGVLHIFKLHVALTDLADHALSRLKGCICNSYQPSRALWATWNLPFAERDVISLRLQRLDQYPTWLLACSCTAWNQAWPRSFAVETFHRLAYGHCLAVAPAKSSQALFTGLDIWQLDGVAGGCWLQIDNKT